MAFGKPQNHSTDPETWLAAHGDYLFRYALTRLRDESLAEDMVQETLLAALKAHERFAGQASEKSWLIGIMKHKIIDHFRKSWREMPVADGKSADENNPGWDELFQASGRWKSPPPAWSAPDKALEQKRLQKTLGLCIEKLPKRLAGVFTMKEMEEMSQEEICKALGITPTNVWVMLYRARMSLRQCLEIHWFGKKRKEVD